MQRRAVKRLRLRIGSFAIEAAGDVYVLAYCGAGGAAGPIAARDSMT